MKILSWFKENLFSTWYNTLLTIVALGLVYFVFKGILTWAFTEANWDVIPANLQLFSVGAYPRAEIWRVWVVFYTVCALLGLSGGIWGGLPFRFALGIGSIVFVCALLPGFEWAAREWLFGSAALLGVFFALGINLRGLVPKVRTWILGAWLLSFPWTLILLRFALGIGSIAFVCALLLGFEWATRGWLFGIAALLGVLFALGINLRGLVPKVRTWVLGAWLLSFPWTLIMLRGFGENSVLTTSWGGLLLTLILAAVGIVFCFPLGVLLALGRRSTLPAVKWVSTAYIELIRGVPLITILFMAKIMIPIFMPDVRLDNVLRAMLGITLFSAAYMAENVRGGIQAIPKGQYEAAQALGLNYPMTTLFIVLPQALRSVIPAIVGQFIALFKDTSLVTIVGLLDLLGIAKAVIANPNWLGLQAEVYLFVAAIYFIFSYAMSYISQKIETALGVGKV